MDGINLLQGLLGVALDTAVAGVWLAIQAVAAVLQPLIEFAFSGITAGSQGT